MSMVEGSVGYRRCCLLYITLVNSLSSASSTSFSTVLWCCSQRPERMPRRMTACSRLRSSAVAKSHHELAAYTSFATTTVNRAPVVQPAAQCKHRVRERMGLPQALWQALFRRASVWRSGNYSWAYSVRD